MRPSTFEGYRAYVRDKIVPYLGDKEIRKVTAGDVQKLYRKLKKENKYAADNSKYLEAKRTKFKEISKLNKAKRKR